MLALDEIARRRGVTRSEAARQAIAGTAEREQQRRGLAAEARRPVADPDYAREAQDVAALMEQLRGPCMSVTSRSTSSATWTKPYVSCSNSRDAAGLAGLA